MTDEKKRPEEGEVADDQLDDVAGGVTKFGEERLASPTTSDNTTGSGTYSKSSPLPTGEGEPDAVMGDLDALGGPPKV